MFAVLRQFRRSQSGVLSVEAAFAFPILIIAAMLVMEVSNIALTINFGEIALQRALQKVRSNDSWEQDSEGLIIQYMSEASHGYVTENNIVSVTADRYDSLDALGQEGLGEEAEGGSDEDATETDLPAWKITVHIRKEFITSLPKMLPLDDNDFHYHYEQILSYLPAQDTGEEE